MVLSAAFALSCKTAMEPGWKWGKVAFRQSLALRRASKSPVNRSHITISLRVEMAFACDLLILP